MFWRTVLNGFRVLLEWRIWIVIVIYSGLMYMHYYRFVNRAFLASIYEKESDAETFRRMDSFSIVKSILDSVLVVLVVFLILPILLGANRLSSFRDLNLALKTIIIIILVATGARIILSKLLGMSKASFGKGSTQMTFFICVFLITFIMHKIVAELPIINRSEVFPSFFLTIGFIFVSFFILLIFSFGVGLVLIPFSEESKKYVTNILTTTISLIMAIIYMRMYCFHILEKVKEININWDAI